LVAKDQGMVMMLNKHSVLACLGPGIQVLEIINVSPNSDKTVGAISQN